MDFDFSMSIHTGEDINSIQKNREAIESIFKKGSSFVSALQIHSNKVYVVKTKRDINWRALSREIEADALITNISNTVLTVLTADCVPILLFDSKRKVIGAVHSGWKGCKENIIRATIETMQNEYGTVASDLLVGIGPSIRGCCYEVGDEVIKEFVEFPNAISKVKESYYLDLAKVTQEQLLSMGVNGGNIEVNTICTSCENKEFFSYRKDKCSGRFMSCISLET